MFLSLGEVASVGDVLCVPAVRCPLATQGPVAGCPRVDSGLCLQICFSGCETSFLASVHSLAGEAGLEACAGFLVGGAGPCHWWMQLGLGCLAGSAGSRGVPRGSSEVRTPQAICLLTSRYAPT